MSNTVGNRISKLMDQKGLTVRELAAMAQVSHTTVANYKNDLVEKPKLRYLEKIAAALSTSAEYLKHGEPRTLNDTINKMPPRLVPSAPRETLSDDF